MGDYNMILISSFLSNTAACSLPMGIHKLKRTVSGNLPSTAVTALLSGFHLAGYQYVCTGLRHWKITLPGGLRAENPFHRNHTLYTHALPLHQCYHPPSQFCI